MANTPEVASGLSARRPRLLDLFCGAGIGAVGYQLAGFEIVGIDIEPQPHYPFEFQQGDALAVLRGFTNYLDSDDGARWEDDFDAIHASPPCQWGTAYGRRPNHVKDAPNLVAPVRELLEATGLPYVIEQPENNRRALRAPITLCGSSFGLDVRRHRCFESNMPMMAPPCDHSWQTPRFAPATNRTNLRSTVEVGVWRIPLDVQKAAMGVEREVTLEELSLGIPPAYTEWIGHQLLGQRLMAQITSVKSDYPKETE